MSESTPAPPKFAHFDDLTVGDYVRFVTIDNGYGGMGEVWRTGKVTRITARTITVECDENLLGDTAILRRAEWGARSVRRGPTPSDGQPTPLNMLSQ
ncbi:hypothetical protein ABT282_08455 [Streptomyces sp. NPDC000927]|uniref:hypothetical protein n=1 Tax=Streptomyces sp. NPDC000927 TaxID=3154371 RepID=UPI0033328B77